MPIYEYLCSSCQQISTRERKAPNRNKRVKCGHCRSTTPELIISRTSFALTGGGWASQGYSVGKPPSTKKVK